MQVHLRFIAAYQMNVPLAIYTLTMDKSEESYVANVVVNQFQEEFRGQENNVSRFHPIQLSIITEFVNYSTILHQRS